MTRFCVPTVVNYCKVHYLNLNGTMYLVLVCTW